MRNVAGFALTMSSVFLAVVAVLIQAPSLFYMGTGPVRIDRGLQLAGLVGSAWTPIRKMAPASVQVGERVTVKSPFGANIVFRRPLITVEDRLPSKLGAFEISPSLPVAPAYDRPIETMYQFTAAKRGAVSMDRSIGRRHRCFGFGDKASQL